MHKENGRSGEWWVDGEENGRGDRGVKREEQVERTCGVKALEKDFYQCGLVPMVPHDLHLAVSMSAHLYPYSAI